MAGGWGRQRVAVGRVVAGATSDQIDMQNGEIDALNVRVLAVEQDNDTEAEQLQSLRDWQANAQATASMTTAALAATNASVASLSSIVSNQGASISTLSALVGGVSTRLTETANGLTTLGGTVGALQGTVAGFNSRVGALETTGATTATRIASLGGAQTAQAKLITDLQASLEDEAQDIAGHETRLSLAETRLSGLATIVSGLQAATPPDSGATDAYAVNYQDPFGLGAPSVGTALDALAYGQQAASMHAQGVDAAILDLQASRTTQTQTNSGVSGRLTDLETFESIQAGKNTTFQQDYFDLQGQLANVASLASQKVTLASANLAGGYLRLDNGSRAALAQLPANLSLAMYASPSWDANANQPALSSGAGVEGETHFVSVAGSHDLGLIGAGGAPSSFAVGDFVAYRAGQWYRIPGNQAPPAQGATAQTTTYSPNSQHASGTNVGDALDALFDTQYTAGQTLASVNQSLNNLIVSVGNDENAAGSLTNRVSNIERSLTADESSEQAQATALQALAGRVTTAEGKITGIQGLYSQSVFKLAEIGNDGFLLPSQTRPVTDTYKLAGSNAAATYAAQAMADAFGFAITQIQGTLTGNNVKTTASNVSATDVNGVLGHGTNYATDTQTLLTGIGNQAAAAPSSLLAANNTWTGTEAFNGNVTVGVASGTTALQVNVPLTVGSGGTGGAVASTFNGTTTVNGTFGASTVNAGVLNASGGTILAGTQVGTSGVPANLTVFGNESVSGTLTLGGNTGTLPSNDTNAQLQVVSKDNVPAAVLVDGIASIPNVTLRRTFGTTASKQPMGAFQFMGNFEIGAYDGTGYASGARIGALSSQAWASGAHGAYLTFQTTATGTTGLVERFRIDQNGNALIMGASGANISSAAPLDVNVSAATAKVVRGPGTVAKLTAVAGQSTTLEIDAFATNPTLILTRYDGTQASPTALVNGDGLGGIGWAGYNGATANNLAATITASTAGAWTSTSIPSLLSLSTTAAASTTAALRLRIDQNGAAQFLYGGAPVGTNNIALELNKSTLASNAGSNASMLITEGDGTSANITLDSFGGLTSPVVAFRTANGSNASKGTTAAGGILGGMGGKGVYSGSYTANLTGSMQAVADSAFTSTSYATRLGLFVTNTGATTPRETLRVAPSGAVGIFAGTLAAAAPQATLDVNANAAGTNNNGANIQVTAADGASANVTLDSFGIPTYLVLRAAAGTNAAKGTTGAGTVLGAMVFGGSTSGNFINTAVVQARSDAAFSGTSQGTRIEFKVTPNNSLTPRESVRFAASGSVGVNPAGVTANPAYSIDTSNDIRARGDAYIGGTDGNADGVALTGAWTPFTPAFASTGGAGVAFAPNTARYKIINKRLWISVDVQVTYTTVPTTVTMTLPGGAKAQGNVPLTAADRTAGSLSLAQCLNGATVQFTPPATSGNYVMFSGVIEIQ